MRIYNTLAKKKEEVKALQNNLIRIYTCGPTIYDYVHIGNLRAFIVSDLLKRALLFAGFKVRHVINLTDVDDKTIKASRERGISLGEYTEKYAKAFFEDIKKLNILPADVFPRATEHIEDMVRLINKLLEKGYAYLAKDGSIYYNISKFKDYGKLSGLKIEKLKEGARISHDNYGKEEARDFALWKAWQEEDGEVFWEPEFLINNEKKKIKGRPGWHIECSAMSMKYLGESFDVHTGGIDLVFPHHENEIAQSEAATGKPFVRYWVHNEWLLVEGKKMSKSLGNFFTLRDLLEKGYKPREIRFVLISTHYRQQLNFTFKALDDARKVLERIDDFFWRIFKLKSEKEEERGKEDLEFIEKAREEFVSKVMDDLDIPKALASFFRFISEINKKLDRGEVGEKSREKILDFLRDFEFVTGIEIKKEEKIPEKILKLVEEREKARREKNFERADEIRKRLAEEGYIIEDTKEGPKVRKKE